MLRCAFIPAFRQNSESLIVGKQELSTVLEGWKVSGRLLDVTSRTEGAFGGHCRWAPTEPQSQLSALPFRNGECHVLQPLLVGLWCADLGHDGAE